MINVGVGGCSYFVQICVCTPVLHAWVVLHELLLVMGTAGQTRKWAHQHACIVHRIVVLTLSKKSHKAHN